MVGGRPATSPEPGQLLPRAPVATPDRPARSNLSFALAVACGATAIVLLAYRDGLHAWFSADDFLWLEIGTLGDVLHSFVGPWGHGAAWRPLSRVSFYLDLLLFGTRAGAWHLESLLWHAGVVTLLVLLLARLTDRPFALVTGAIFALLPLQYENTLWLSARSHPIALSAALGCLLVLDRFLEAPSPRRLLLACMLLAAGLLTYEAAVYTAAFAALLVASHGRRLPWRRGLAAVVAPSLVVAAYVVLRRAVLGDANVYRPHTADWYLTGAFVRQLGDAVSQVVQQIEPSLWWFVAAGIAGSVVAPRTLLLAAAGLVVALVGYLPFSLVDGFGPRFAYAAHAGLAMLLAAAVTGVACVPRLGRPCAAVLLGLLLVHEARATQQIAREFRDAGVLGQQSLAKLAAGWPDPDPDRPAVILGAPVRLGHAMIFFTYFDLALGTFHPAWAGFRLPGHVLTEFDPATSHAIAVDTWHREQERRRRHGLGPLVCRAGDPSATKDVDGFLRALLDCDATFLTIEPGRTVRKLPRASVEERLARGWRSP
jgi:hypothetical protein